jgi:branched-chain amino acid transport system ATP-binding protein
MVGVADRGDVIVPGKIAFAGRSADELNNEDLIKMSHLGAARVAIRPN